MAVFEEVRAYFSIGGTVYHSDPVSFNPLPDEIFEVLKLIKPNTNKEIQITDALLYQAKKGNVIAHKFKGDRFDCGNVKGYLDATNHFAKIQGIGDLDV